MAPVIPQRRLVAKSFYVQRLLNIPKRIGLSKNAQKLLKALDEAEQGVIEEVDLGRQIRLSPVLRDTLRDTISQCTETIISTPAETLTCAETIHRCIKILSIAGMMAVSSTDTKG